MGSPRVAHFSPFVFWLLGPLLVFALTPPGSYPRRGGREGLQLPAHLHGGRIGTIIAAGITDLTIFELLVPLLFVGWLVLTIVGGAKALQGENWKNPVKHVIKVEALSER